jgi:hypothetical protein
VTDDQWQRIRCKTQRMNIWNCILWVVFQGNIHCHTCWCTNNQSKPNRFTPRLKTENLQCSKYGFSIPKQEMALVSTKCQVIVLCSELAVYIQAGSNLTLYIACVQQTADFCF